MTARIHTTTLSNGLALVGEVNPDNKSCAMGCFVKTGARDEQGPEAGISHFLEHMLFKGTPTRSALDLTYALGNLGAQANAYTSEEVTAYYAALTPEAFDPYHELLCDMLRPALTQEDFDTEKQVILEEIALYYDRPHYFLFEQAIPEYYGNHPAGHSVLGTTESVSAITRDMMSDYFSRRYVPEGMTFVATGRFDWDAFVKQTEARCGQWSGAAAARLLPPFHGNDVARTYTHPNTKQAHLLLLGTGASAQSEDRFPLALLSLVLGDTVGSKLYWELVETGLADSASADHDEKDGTGSFSVYVSTEPANLDKVAKIAKAVVSKPMDFTEADLERAKAKLIAKMVLGGELPLGRLMALGNSWVYRKDSPSLSVSIERVRSVSRGHIESAVKRVYGGQWAEFRLLPE